MLAITRYSTCVRVKRCFSVRACVNAISRSFPALAISTGMSILATRMRMIDVARPIAKYHNPCTRFLLFSGSMFVAVKRRFMNNPGQLNSMTYAYIAGGPAKPAAGQLPWRG